ncbi:MAG: hypothetical protein ACK5O3_09900 [Burkholderiales bacterium]
MPKVRAHSLALAALALAASGAQSQEPAKALEWMLAQAAPLAPVAPLPPLPFMDEVFEFAGRELGGEAVVKGAPYCAMAVHESVQPLLDGNRIVRRHTSQLCRDGEGRTRHEVQREGGNKRVYLRDPVAGEGWVLDPERKTARRIAMAAEGTQRSRGAELASAQAERQRDMAERQRDMAQRHRDMAELQRDAADRWREQSERWREWAQEVAKRARDASAPGETRVHVSRQAASGAEPGVVIETETRTRTEGRPEERQREVRVIRLNDLPALPPMAPMPPAPPMPPMPALAQLAAAPGFSFSLNQADRRGPGVRTALASKDLEGVKVNGERTTWTIEAGKLGNEKPILITREVWRSPELMLVVQSRDADPRSGEVNYRLEKLKRGEPDAALMKVPTDYQQPARRAPSAKS